MIINDNLNFDAV